MIIFFGEFENIFKSYCWAFLLEILFKKYLIRRKIFTLQAQCLDDIPATLDTYDFNTEQQLPGEKVSALDQCVKSFGSLFKPYLKSSQSPFEDPCRELWCSNLTHALRAHPALEGTDCR